MNQKDKKLIKGKKKEEKEDKKKKRRKKKEKKIFTRTQRLVFVL